MATCDDTKHRDECLTEAYRDDEIRLGGRAQPIYLPAPAAKSGRPRIGRDGPGGHRRRSCHNVKLFAGFSDVQQ